MNQRRNGKACRAVVENTMLLSFDIKIFSETRNSVGMARLVEQLVSCYQVYQARPETA